MSFLSAKVFILSTYCINFQNFGTYGYAGSATLLSRKLLRPVRARFWVVSEGQTQSKEHMMSMSLNNILHIST